MKHERAEDAREATHQRRHETLKDSQPAARQIGLPSGAVTVLGLQRSIGNRATVRALRALGATSGASPLLVQRKPVEDAPGGDGSTAILGAVGELVKVYNQHAGSGGSSASTEEAKESTTGGGTEGGTTTTWERGKYALNQAGGGAERRVSTPIGQQRRAFNPVRSGTSAGPSAAQDEVAGMVGGSGADAAPLPLSWMHPKEKYIKEKAEKERKEKKKEKWDAMSEEERKEYLQELEMEARLSDPNWKR